MGLVLPCAQHFWSRMVSKIVIVLTTWVRLMYSESPYGQLCFFEIWLKIRLIFDTSQTQVFVLVSRDCSLLCVVGV